MKLYIHHTIGCRDYLETEPAWFVRTTVTGDDDCKYPQEIWCIRLPGRHWKLRMINQTYGWTVMHWVWNLRTGEFGIWYGPP